MYKRKPEIVVLSDIHLGTYGCHARELQNYLESIEPETLILNGDIIDFWSLKKSTFPQSHIRILDTLIQMAYEGTKIYYITGNHDDVLRQLSSFSMGNINLRDKLILNVDQKKYWIFHGDVFDTSITITPLLAKIGGISYDWLIKFNRLVNKWRLKMGKGRISLSKSVKSGVKRAITFINDFEKIIISKAIQQGYHYVICGHIHHPVIKNISTSKGKTIYMNAGDWVENLTSLEYFDGEWTIYEYDDLDFQIKNPKLDIKSHKSILRNNKPSEIKNIINL
ncbi:UDP-2,3-diacylglucosamine diphosphatase [Membranihabitans maritimus]|uniref:UDP-2,3-diacylglucosamine diphosphatase n=1 Tax=Membranihabitans maritimus TaxID=2904244 RepID=UPI001F445ED0|nr:UDP-2,3-diacylglucosamine diphosphatase [Membranihabitans maritimus]